jgi:pantetheine-phosphate adenylyltransferase
VSGIRAVYGGTFDPVTNGHLDMIRRGAALLGGLRVCVSRRGRETLFSADERVDLLRRATAGIPGVEVEPFEGLLAEHARRRGARLLLRAIRGPGDYEYEMQMTFANRGLAPGIETVFLVPSVETGLISSTLVREVHGLGGDVSAWVPEVVVAALAAKRTPRGD